jgi:hypothetical protein
MCPASVLPSAGGSKFDNSAFSDPSFESMRCFVLARYLMSFDIPPLMMLSQVIGNVVPGTYKRTLIEDVQYLYPVVRSERYVQINGHSGVPYNYCT